MGIVLDTPLVHKSFTSVLQKITPNAHIYDNPNQQGTKIPAWFIVHREPVTIERDLDKRAWLTYGIDLYYMLDYNLPRTFDSYSSVADALNTELKYLTIYGTTFKVHVQNRSWSLQLDCLRYSTTLKFRVSETEEPETKMQTISTEVFLKTVNKIRARYGMPPVDANWQPINQPQPQTPQTDTQTGTDSTQTNESGTGEQIPCDGQNDEQGANSVANTGG